MRTISRRLLLLLAAIFALTFFAPTLKHNQAYAEKPYEDVPIDQIHSIYWKCKTMHDITVTIEQTGEERKIESGTTFTCTYYSLYSTCSGMLHDGSKFKLSKDDFYTIENMCTPGDFKKSTKEAYVNSRKLKSKTKYLIWVSTDRQSLTVFTGKNRHWKVLKVFPCSTGMAQYATPLGVKKLGYKKELLISEQWGGKLNWFCSFGGSGIHSWPNGGNGGHYMGRVPCSHACVRLRQRHAKWVYKHIPKGTTILIY